MFYTQTWPLYSAGDNIIVDPNTGDLLVACHPVVYAFTKHAEDLKTLSPSQVSHYRHRRAMTVTDGPLPSHMGHYRHNWVTIVTGGSLPSHVGTYYYYRWVLIIITGGYLLA